MMCLSVPGEHLVPSINNGAAKQATNVSTRRDLVVAARQAGINLSETLELALVAELHTRRKQRWLEKNGDAIATYNAALTPTATQGRY